MIGSQERDKKGVDCIGMNKAEQSHDVAGASRSTEVKTLGVGTS